MNRRAIIVACLLAILVVVVLVYVILSSPSSTVLSVEPRTVHEAVGQTFTVNVSISNIADLYGWQIDCSWNQSVLNVTNVIEGPMLRSSGNSTFFSPEVDAAAGNLSALCTRKNSLGSSVVGVSGSGTLMTIQFKVIASGECDLNLYNTQLLDSKIQTISHTVQDSHFST
jgi:hypothetical protein